MDKDLELLGKRIDNVSQLLRQPMNSWALNYWTTVYQILVRQLNAEYAKTGRTIRRVNRQSAD